jgi:hypothetical protein
MDKDLCSAGRLSAEVSPVSLKLLDSPHGTDRVGRGRADADGEQVKCGYDGVFCASGQTGVRVGILPSRREG